jgi:hypothetical protein
MIADSLAEQRLDRSDRVAGAVRRPDAAAGGQPAG